MADEPDVDPVREFLFRRYPMPALRPVAPEDEVAVAEAAMVEIEVIIRKQVLPFEPAFRALDKRQRTRAKAGGLFANILFGDDIAAQIKAAAMEDPRRLVHQSADDPDNDLAFADASAVQRYLAYHFERLALRVSASQRIAILEVVQQLARDIATTNGKLSATLDRNPPSTPKTEQRTLETKEISRIARGLLDRNAGRKKPRSQLEIARLILIESGWVDPTLRQRKTLVERCRRAGIPLIVPR